MATKKRQVRKAALDWIEKRVELDQLNYQRVMRKARGTAKLIGVGVATGLYGLGFAGGFTGMQNGYVTGEGFAKLVWMLIIPASVVGSLAWMIFDGRLCYPLRRTMANYVAKVEAEDGFLWRFGPLLLNSPAKELKRIAIADAIQLSRNRRGGEIDPEDYAAMMQFIYRLLTGSDADKLSTDVAQQLESNLRLV